ncbi:MAG: hypothetical protein EXQ95_04565 [Alphaproteobacteria bacterium]|nr:hypothetical protein [Alphaproteobacteria bacterium]
MVAITGPTSIPPSEFAPPTPAVAALARLKQRPVPTEAQADALVRLETVRAEMQDAPAKAAAAKVAHLRNKLMAINLAARTASATGDLKFARSAIADVRALAKELAQALKDAGLIKESGVLAGAKAKDESTATTKETTGEADTGEAREGGRELVKELHKIVAKLRVALIAAQIRGASPQEIKDVEKQLRDGEKELQSLNGALGAKAGGERVVDFRA